MSLEAGEFAIQSGTGGGREAESPPTNLEGLPRTLAPSLNFSPLLLPRCLSSPSPACLFSTKFLPLALRASSPFSLLPLFFLSSPPLRLSQLYGSRFYVYKTRRARFDAKTTLCREHALVSREFDVTARRDANSAVAENQVLRVILSSRLFLLLMQSMYRLSQLISINFRDELRLKKEIGKHMITQRMSWNYYYSYVNMNEAI